MKLVVISHTAHYLTNEGKIAGWGPTTRELDHLAMLFDDVVHVAPFHSNNPSPGFIPYANKRIEYVPIHPTGGKSLLKKLGVVLRAPFNLFIIARQVLKSDWVHVRLPTNLGVYVLPFLYIIGRRNVWVKYAGNWNHPDPPLSYRFQRWFLIKNYLKAKVTINGRWPGQPAHVLSFENPCFSEAELLLAAKQSSEKSFDGELTICFAGTLNPGKGVVKLIQALQKFTHRRGIQQLIIVGDGPELKHAQTAAQGLSIPVKFTGYLSHYAIRSVYEQAHIIVLPSDSEGFPKVIAEAASFRCVPVVSDVSSISQYVFHKRSGVLLPDTTVDLIADSIIQLLLDREQLKNMADASQQMASQFTYERFCTRIKNEILASCD